MEKAGTMKKALIILFGFWLSGQVQAQTAPGKYLVWFTDKNHNTYSLSNPGNFLSERALDRRLRNNIPLTPADLPVSKYYLDSIGRMGCHVINTSRWFNNATVAIPDTSVLSLLKTVSFIDQQKTTYSVTPYAGKKSKPLHPLEFIAGMNFPGNSYYGGSYAQIALEKGDELQKLGFRGHGMQIALLDAGFYKANQMPSLDSLFADGRILGTRDFVSPGNDVYQEHPHGMNVLSIIGGNLPQVFIGTAPDASFWLFRSEDANSEMLIEEDNWVAAAEAADSAGADIISTSLGYSQFDWTVQNHTYQDMNGKSTRISLAADMASDRGILVVVSAGNEGNLPWKYITAPADAFNVIACGATDSLGVYATFSSQGPSYDGRVKPNVAAMGRATLVQLPDGTFGRGSGTSFSAPVISGLAACLWQAYPRASNHDLKQAIEQSCNHYSEPDYFTGYGIPDFRKAYDLLGQAMKEKFAGERDIVAFPDPFTTFFSLRITDPLPDASVTVNLYDLNGKLIMSTRQSVTGHYIYQVQVPQTVSLSKGIYLVKVITANHTYTLKAAKL